MYVLLVLIVMIVSGTLIVTLTRQNEYDAIEERIRTAASYVTNQVADETSEEAVFTVLKQTIENTQLQYLNERIFLLDKSSTVVYSITPLEEKEFYTPQVVSAQNKGTLSQMDKVELDGKKYLGYATPVVFEDKVLYVIYVLGDLTSINANIREAIMVMLLAVAVAFIVAIILGILFSDFITRPIALLSRRARDMTRGRLDMKLKVQSDDEIGQLTANFNQMAVSLNDTLNEITSEKNKLEIVFQNMSDGILVFDWKGEMIHNNPASVKLLDLEGLSSYQEIFSGYLDLDYAELRESVQEHPYSHIIIFGEKFYNIYFANFMNQYDEAMGIICVIQDITEHKRLEEMQKEFVANVSHELRTPLTTIKSYAETLLDGAMDDRETAERFLAVINNEGDRMTTLVQDLLELSRLDNKQIRMVMQDMNLELILEECVEKYQIQAARKEQRLIYYPPEKKNCRIIGDPNRVEQVFKNIISNAIKYSGEKTLIEVSLLESDRKYKVVVSDSGMGISREDLPRIFERFYRVDKARSRELGGTGLGLAIAKEIMELHGGRIEAESEMEKGTTFYLSFPRQQAVTGL